MLGRSGRQKGFVLIIVLWGVGLLAVIALTFAQNTRLNSKAARNVISNGQARALAEAGVQIAIKDGISILYQRRVPANPRIRVDGTPFFCRMPGNAVAQIQIWDEGGKIDLNAARRDLLEAMITGLGKAPSEAKLLARAVSDYRDSNTARVGGGSEEARYQQANRPYGPKDWPFEALSEFAQVPGITPEVFQALKPFLTVLSGNNGFDRHVAPLGLLALMSKGGGGGTDRSAFEVPSKFVRRSAQFQFTVRSAIQMPEGGRFVREAAIATASSSDHLYDFREWKRGPNRPGDFGAAATQTLPAC